MDNTPFTDIELHNVSNDKIMALSYFSYSDTLLSHTRAEEAVNPSDYIYLAWWSNWKSKSGLTLYIFDYDYYWANYVSNQPPDSFLSLDNVLAYYNFEMDFIKDSLDYKIYYPDSLNDILIHNQKYGLKL